MAAVIGALRADLSASVAKFEQDMGKAAKAVEAFGRRTQAIAQNLEAAGQRMTLAITAPFVALGVTAARAAAESRDAIAQVEARLASMGDASGKTADELELSAKQLQRLSTFDDDDILRNVTAAMLTFGNVAGESFDRGQRAAVDMATALGQDLQSATIMIGRALNDPIRGITAMTRAGVSFTQAQKDQIKQLTEAGRIYEAQSIILSELEREFMGAGLAAREAVPGSDAIDSWREFQEAVGEVFLRALEAVEPMLIRVLDSFNNLTPQMQTFIVAAGGVAAAIGPLLWAAGAFAGAVANLAPLWAGFVKIFTDAMVVAGITNVGVAIRALAAFLGPWVGLIVAAAAAFIEFRGAFEEAFGYLVTHFQNAVMPALENLGAAIGELFAAFDGIMDGPLGEFVDFVGWAVAEIAALFLQGLGHAVLMAVSTFVDLLATAIRAVADLVAIVGDLLSGDWQGAWDGAQRFVENAASGILAALENLVPGITSAAQAMGEGFQQWAADRIGEAITWIEGRFPGLVDALAAAAQGAVAWARNLYEGVRTWINDNLGPVIRWAQDRIRELNSLFGQIRRRQDQVRGGGPAQPVQPTAAPAPPPRRTGGGGGGGGAGGGGGRRGASDAEREARRIQQATEKFQEALEDVQTGIDRAFERTALPRSIQQANDLRRRIAELSAEAAEAGVDISAFADTIALLEERIEELETEGLQREAEEFARETRELAQDVQNLAGGMGPLEERLAEVDQRFGALRQSIEEAIEENRVLAESNATAAEAMAGLERQLVALDAAHAKATEAARAQYEAEQRLFDLQAAADQADAAQAIADLRRRRGEDNTVSRGAQDLRRIEEELAEQRRAAAIELAALERERLAAELAGDEAQVARLTQQIALQDELYGLVTETTAVQIQAAERLQRAFEDFTDSLSDELTDMIMDWEFDLDGLRSVFQQLARQLFIQPVTDSFAAGIGNFLKGFAGGFATGGTLAPGTWGIAGENGPEPIFAGASSLSVMPTEEAFGRRGGDVIFNVQTPNADSFRYSQRQLARRAKQTLGA